LMEAEIFKKTDGEKCALTRKILTKKKKKGPERGEPPAYPQLLEIFEVREKN